jgi:hypothetical protein
MSYEIPSNLPQPTRFEADGSPTWVFEGGEWTNRGWIVPLERLAEYIVPQEPPPQPGEPVPESVGPAQIRLALLDLYGVTDEMIRGSIEQLPEPNKTRALILYDYSAEFRRSNPFIDAIGTMLGINDEQINDLYRYAVTL